jgi:DNA-directed RNA polymerase specialized sigma24 family protein
MTDETGAAPSTRQRWQLNHRAFDLLLAALDADRVAASRKYETLRGKLINLFAWERCEAPEELADEALDRLARKLADGAALQSPDQYVLGIARRMLLEQRRASYLKQTALRALRYFGGPGGRDAELLRSAERCLAELPAESRDLIERYYAEDRDAIASELDISVNALRNRALRIREKLLDCITKGAR